MAEKKGKIFRVPHEVPRGMFSDFILLPYGEYYEKTKVLLGAKGGDILRFFNGPDVKIEYVSLIPCDKFCDFLCRMRYSITWDKALAKWRSYARMEGNGKDILSDTECIFIGYESVNKS